MTELFNGNASDPQISFAVSADDGGDTPKRLRGLTCIQYKRGRKIHGSKSVPRRVWRAELEDDPEGGGG